MNLDRAVDRAIARENANPRGLPPEDIAALDVPYLPVFKCSVKGCTGKATENVAIAVNGQKRSFPFCQTHSDEIVADGYPTTGVVK